MIVLRTGEVDTRLFKSRDTLRGLSVKDWNMAIDSVYPDGHFQTRWTDCWSFQPVSSMMCAYVYSSGPVLSVGRRDSLEPPAT